MHSQPSGCPTFAAQRLRWENTAPNPPDALKPDAGEPTAADYQALLHRIHATMQSYAAGEIDFPALRRQINEIEAITRTFNLLRKLRRAARRLGGEIKTPKNWP